MRSADPVMTTLRSDAEWLVCARYECPEGLRLIKSLRAMATIALFALYAWSAVNMTRSWTSSLSDGERMVAILTMITIAWGPARLSGSQLAAVRFGLRGILDRTTRVAMSREAVTVGGTTYARDRKIAFTSEPHRLAKAEERSERVSGETIPETYRAAHEVKLQHGETFIVLAEVSDDRAANAIVRRLQVVDEFATRGTGAKGAGFGPRQSPE